MAQSPPQRIHTPLQTTGISLPPPAKRQKLSPGPSPLGTQYQYGSQPYSPSPQLQTVPHLSLPSDNPLYSFNQPQPVQPPQTDGRPAPGTMGPPERPKADKATDINDLSDLVTASGIDLREEENYLAATYRNRHQEASFTSSFGTASSTISPESSFHQWSQGSHGTQPAFQSHGPLSQPAVSQEEIENEIKAKHKRAARSLAERRQKHLNDPFLQSQIVRDRIQKRTVEYQVRFNARGYHDPQEPKSVPQEPQGVRATTMMGADGTGAIAAKASGLLDQDAPLVDILSLLSLACNERMRSLLEDAYAISRARQYGSQGVVPPEWANIAQGNGTPEETMARSQSITRTAWDQPPDSAVSPMTVVPLKREATDTAEPNRLPTPPTEPDLPRLPTIAFTSPLPSVLKGIASSDREAEKKRLERRKKRDKDRQNSIVSDAASPSTPTAAPATPAPEIAPPAQKTTKKELAKQKGAQLTEEHQRRQANQTANMALGNMGKKYSWMTAAAAGPAAGLAAGAGIGRGSTAVSRTASGTVPLAQHEDAGLRSKEFWKKLGEWREGKDVQMRDFITVLERDGVEKKTLAKCYARLSSAEKERQAEENSGADASTPRPSVSK